VVGLDQKTGKLLWRRPVGIHNGHDDDGLLAMRGEYGKLKTPMTVYPGVFGGVAGSLALRGSTVFVPVVNYATRLDSQIGAAMVSGSEGGELVALDVSTGAVKWKESLGSPVYGPTLATNDLVFALTFDGLLHGFDADSGERIWGRRVAPYAEGGLAATGSTLLVRAGFPQAEEVPRLMALSVDD
ncbi:MAG TPA: PQQ-binding-like beta-propeller repeat protein, partial [Solirubrobacterales bacterium]|nr:PQQ-binding-like beta-propeller repeat protein [Solirubrobacterales bacterium]